MDYYQVDLNWEDTGDVVSKYELASHRALGTVQQMNHFGRLPHLSIAYRKQLGGRFNYLSRLLEDVADKHLQEKLKGSIQISR